MKRLTFVVLGLECQYVGIGVLPPGFQDGVYVLDQVAVVIIGQKADVTAGQAQGVVAVAGQAFALLESYGYVLSLGECSRNMDIGYLAVVLDGYGVADIGPGGACFCLTVA